MSTEIKPGQVWAKDDDHDYEVKVVWASRDSVHYERPTVGESRAQAKAFLYEYHLVKDVDATPAPLDPKSVHVGDTVTVRFIETGDVLTTKAYQPDDITAAGEYVYILGWPLHRPNGTFGLAVSHFEILAIEPAAMPEPEWKPGTVAVVEVDGDNTYRAIRNDEGQWDAENHWTYSDDEVTDARPLVVIDPAAVMDELVDSLSHALGERLPPEAVAYISRTDGNNDRQKWVRGLLNHAQPNLVRSAFQVLGIEATS